MTYAALARAHVYATHHSNYGGSSQHGGAFPYRGLRRRAARRARPRGARLAHGLLRRRGACLSAFPTFPVARQPNRVRARPPRARWHAVDPRERARGDAHVFSRRWMSRRAPFDGARGPSDPVRRPRRQRACLRSGLGSGFTLRGEDKMRGNSAQEALPAALRSPRRRVGEPSRAL